VPNLLLSGNEANVPFAVASGKVTLRMPGRTVGLLQHATLCNSTDRDSGGYQSRNEAFGQLVVKPASFREQQ
jgi:hypothetical protein